ncbi:hypothetical protein [Methylocella silvestris]|uniref:hypothetical protein n=1 Tax=Methylocella silvestris TaxID=199596 RepID=UPI0011AF5879|nr:hypothetical protein [Methylocella silvestris]
MAVEDVRFLFTQACANIAKLTLRDGLHLPAAGQGQGAPQQEPDVRQISKRFIVGDGIPSASIAGDA